MVMYLPSSFLYSQKNAFIHPQGIFTPMCP
jgi:hypothetical protein